MEYMITAGTVLIYSIPGTTSNPISCSILKAGERLPVSGNGLIRSTRPCFSTFSGET
jgi:hypothetical protein